MTNDPIFQLTRLPNGKTVNLDAHEVARILVAVEKQAKVCEPVDPLGRLMGGAYSDLLKKLQTI